MSNIYDSIEQLIGCTPLLQLHNIQAELGLKARLLAKLEYFNPAGSAKDRVARSMLDAAEAAGLLQPGATIIEPTSGNTGIGLAMLAAVRGYRLIIVMPETMSAERQQLMRAYGAQLELTAGELGMSGAIQRAQQLAAQLPGSFIPDQFANPANPRAHFDSTGPEIWADCQGQVDVFVAGVGTGGSISGTGNYLKQQNPLLHVVAVEPSGSPVLAGGQAGSHGLQGIGAGFVPAALDTSVYDEVVAVDEQQAYQAARLLARREGVLAGISSGAALFAAIEQAKRESNRGKTIVVLLPDLGDRYLSTPLFQD